MVTTEDVLTALQDVADPEIAISVVELGLVYNVDIDDSKVHVKMGVTTPACPFYGTMVIEAQERLEAVEGVDEATVELDFDTPWTPDMMSDIAKQLLGFM